MFIIIVGPDGAGKTTLAKQLAKQTGFEVIKRDKPKTTEEKRRMFEEYCHLILQKNNIIFDRFVHCELIYGPIKRDEHNVSKEEVEYIESLLAMKGAIIIHCTDDLEKLWGRCVARGEDYITEKEMLSDIVKGYKKLFATPHLIPVVEYKIPDAENM